MREDWRQGQRSKLRSTKGEAKQGQRSKLRSTKAAAHGLSLSGILCVGHNMTIRSMYAEQDEAGGDGTPTFRLTTRGFHRVTGWTQCSERCLSRSSGLRGTESSVNYVAISDEASVSSKDGCRSPLAGSRETLKTNGVVEFGCFHTPEPDVRLAGLVWGVAAGDAPQFTECWCAYRSERRRRSLR